MKQMAIVLAFWLSWLQSTKAAQGAVEVSLECRQAAPTGALRLILQNDGIEDTALLLGMALANGRSYELRDLTLLVKRADAEVIEEYQYRSRRFPMGFAGRMDHWILALPRGSGFNMMLSPTDFFSARTFTRLGRLPSPAEVAVQLLGRPITYDLNPDMGGLRDVRLWTGTATSHSVRVPEDCRE